MDELEAVVVANQLGYKDVYCAFNLNRSISAHLKKLPAAADQRAILPSSVPSDASYI